MDMSFFSQLIEKAIDNSKATVSSEDGSKFIAVVISDSFEEMMPVKRHQTVYKIFNEQIANGMMHALSIEAYTQSEWDKKNT
jgi:acid stress-induced BolA-like protein IbaG/YrbA